jgi:hypothetical protein
MTRLTFIRSCLLLTTAFIAGCNKPRSTNSPLHSKQRRIVELRLELEQLRHANRSRHVPINDPSAGENYDDPERAKAQAKMIAIENELDALGETRHRLPR